MKLSKLELVIVDNDKILHRNSNDHTKIECPICNRKVTPYWESRYNGIRASCETCGINWAES